MKPFQLSSLWTRSVPWNQRPPLRAGWAALGRAPGRAPAQAEQSCVPGPSVPHCSELWLSEKVPPSKEGEHQHLIDPHLPSVTWCAPGAQGTPAPYRAVSAGPRQSPTPLLLPSSAFPSSESLLPGFYSICSPLWPLLGPTLPNKVPGRVLIEWKV